MSVTSDRIELHQPMRITKVGGLTTDELKARAYERAFDSAVFAGRDLFFFDAEISNRNLDFYGTRMLDDSLQNYAADAESGVSFQNSHDVYSLGLGRSLHGRYVESDETDKYGVKINRAFATFYTASDIAISDVNTDHFIAGVQAGLIHDVSIGFYADEYRCSICGQAMYEGWFGFYPECEHVPGLTYTVTNEDGSPLLDVNGGVVTRLAWVDIAGGHLLEVSAVYKGATPEASILKADLLAKSGRMSDLDRRRFEGKYRCVLPDKVETFLAATAPRSSGAHDMPSEEQIKARAAKRRAAKEEPEANKEENPVVVDETPVVDDVLEDETTITLEDGDDVEEDTEFDDDDDSDDEEETPDTEQRSVSDPFAGIRDELATRGIKLGTDPVKAVRALVSKLDEYSKDAKTGRQYRRDVIDEAIKAGVRARGDKFDEAKYRGVLNKLDIEEIKQFRDDWTDEGTRMLAGNTETEIGGRLTLLANPNGSNETPSKKRPRAAYSG